MMGDFLYTMGGLGSTPLVPLPPKFKISDVEKFDKSGDPRQHIRQYLNSVGMKGLDEKQALCAFPTSLTGNASRWYYNLDPSKTKVWLMWLWETWRLLSKGAMKHSLSIWWGGRTKFQDC